MLVARLGGGLNLTCAGARDGALAPTMTTLASSSDPRRDHAHGTSGSSLTHQSGTPMDPAWVGVFSARGRARQALPRRDLRVRYAGLVVGTEAARLLKAKNAAA